MDLYQLTLNVESCLIPTILFIFEFPKFMTKEDTLKVDGVVEELLPNMNFQVTLENGMTVIAHLCGKMRMRNIRVSKGDRVTVEMSPYDLSKARITYRYK